MDTEQQFGHIVVRVLKQRLVHSAQPKEFLIRQQGQPILLQVDVPHPRLRRNRQMLGTLHLFPFVRMLEADPGLLMQVYTQTPNRLRCLATNRYLQLS